MQRRPISRAAAAAILAALLAVGTAAANGKPIQIVLTHQPTISTVGPESASGIAELVMAEGEARVIATGLPRLDPPQHYEAWVVNTGTNEFAALGSFNAAYTTKEARLDTVLPQAIPDRGWNLFLVTVEEAPQPSRPSGQRSIAGFFPPSGGQAQPNVLPNTGGAAAEAGSQAARPQQADWALAGGLAALTLLAGTAAGYAVGRRRVAGRSTGPRAPAP